MDAYYTYDPVNTPQALAIERQKAHDRLNPYYSEWVKAGMPGTIDDFARTGQIKKDNDVQVAKDRTNMQSFIKSMATPGQDVANARIVGDVTKYGNAMDDYLKRPMPAASNSNRFEQGLSQNEGRLNALLTDPNSIQQTAAYKFRVGQGEEALQRNLAAKGLLNSGNRLTELTKYGQDMGSQEYGNQVDRLSGLVGQYGQNWLGDKNANTGRLTAESNAWNHRGAVIGDLYKTAGTNYSQNSSVDNQNKIRAGQLYESGRQANMANALDKIKMNVGASNSNNTYGYRGY